MSNAAVPHTTNPCPYCGLKLVNLVVTDGGKVEVVEVDACIAPIIQALNNAGIPTTESCCGHGKMGCIFLQDGRMLGIEWPAKTKEPGA